MSARIQDPPCQVCGVREDICERSVRGCCDLCTHGEMAGQLLAFGLTHYPTTAVPHTRPTDPDTSHAAAERVEPAVGTQRGKILAFLRAYPLGGTSEEIAEATGYKRDSLSPRFRPLADEGFIADSGRRRANQIVWVAL